MLKDYAPVNHIPERSDELLEFDRLRPAYMQHVISPLAHTAVARTVDLLRDRLLDDMEGYKDHKIQIKQQGIYIKTAYRPDRHAHHGLYTIAEKLELEGRQTYYPVWDTQSDRQKAASQRFTTFANSSSPDGVLFDASGTVTDTLLTIHSRHPELELYDTTNMATFLRHPLTPGILRGFQIGGNSFPDGLRGFNMHPSGKPWRDDPRRAVLDTSGEHPRTSREVRDAAYKHRAINETLDANSLPQNGIFNVAMRYSSGCPVRHLYFSTDEESLVANDLNLTSLQVDHLMNGERPAVQPIDEHRYRITRDATATVVNLLADALEVLAKK